VSARPRYRLPDEPRPGPLAANVSDPLWPFLGMMLVGTWFGLAWFAFNSFALGSPTRLREIGLIALALLGSVVLVLALSAAFAHGWLDERSLRYAWLSMTCLRMGCAYGLSVLQSRVFELHTYFGGGARTGATLLVLAMVIVRPTVAPLFSHSVIGLVLQ
jgi:hypothetical protein